MKSRSSVAGIAFDRQGRLFIARRLDGGDLGGKWEFPGGKVREGERDGDALRREFREELGIDVEVRGFIAEAEFDHRDTRFTLRAWEVAFAPENVTLSVHSRWRWAAFAELAEMDFAPSDRLLFPALGRLESGAAHKEISS
ncbi:MAG: (deoxy)nucleoside triphosphate pyrophosphohydrolase [Treponema sp.]|nr:(deoxy)nucleoside triphosphate pyrophosphohydrolase [Treponema sp.]